ncbi:hypothetical protein Dimus_028428 [Dionaea muscipula]
MEKRDDLGSILPFLPLSLESSSLVWPNQVVEALKALSRGPSHSRVDSGEVLYLAISDIRDSLSFTSSDRLAPSTGDGYALFFDEFLSREEARKWFGEVIPAMARLLLRFPALLESHYRSADSVLAGVETGLRLLRSQQSGIVILSQELIGAILTCSFFCMFPTAKRYSTHLPMINFDLLLASLYERYNESQENKIKCIIHYFERIYSSIPPGYVSFERKVLPMEQNLHFVTYPLTEFWATSKVPLCQFEVCRSGLIENHLEGALEVDFANEYLGGGALHMGCVQEEIRFMINPELIAGMLFLPSMSDNEAIEIVGTERFSDYSGYASSFRFSGDYMDQREIGSLGRRNTRIIAIDALCWPGFRQYGLDCLLREVNKAFCGFLDQSKYHYHQIVLHDSRTGLADDNGGASFVPHNQVSPSNRDVTISNDNKEVKMCEGQIDDIRGTSSNLLNHQNDAGVATGNWGCGAFGGDPELKTVIQWLAASQALRPQVSYYTFEMKALENLDQVTQWILSHKWTVGDLWTLMVDYSSKRRRGETDLGLFSWLLPNL